MQNTTGTIPWGANDHDYGGLGVPQQNCLSSVSISLLLFIYFPFLLA